MARHRKKDPTDGYLDEGNAKLSPEELAALKDLDQLAENAHKRKLPPWFPRDLDVRASRLASGMVSHLSREALEQVARGETLKLTPKKRDTHFRGIILGVIDSEEFREELAKHALMDPLSFLKIQASLIPKALHVEGEVKHRHVAVLPGVIPAEQWNQAHAARKELADGDWAIQLKDTPFSGRVPVGEVVDAEVIENGGTDGSNSDQRVSEAAGPSAEQLRAG